MWNVAVDNGGSFGQGGFCFGEKGHERVLSLIGIVQVNHLKGLKLHRTDLKQLGIEDMPQPDNIVFGQSDFSGVLEKRICAQRNIPEGI
mgnify:CR=1 FL=1